MPNAYEEFLDRYPEYLETGKIDSLRARDYSRLDREGQVYLDYTGAGLYAESQVERHRELLLSSVFGNPHSSNPSSSAAERLVESARSSVLRFFRASPEEYELVFTQNASGALRIVGEAYPFTKGGAYLLSFDNHNSVNGIREFAHAKGAKVSYVPLVLPDLRIDEARLEEALDAKAGSPDRLFAYPAQSNFSSVKHPLGWIEKAHARGWDVLLDAAAFAPTNRLDLGEHKPDFVPLSFYKIFGYPTGLGALIVRKDKLGKLRRPWFSGGTITVASVQGDRYYLAEGHAAFEDGTVDFLGIPAVEIGIRHIESIGIDMIEKRTRCLTGWLLENMESLKHRTGVSLARIYGPLTTEARGGAITVNFFDKKDEPIDNRTIEKAANAAKISIRTGCFCNPGAGELALGISREELVSCFAGPGREERLKFDDFRLCIDGKASGAVRASVGLVSNFADAQAFLKFAETMLGCFLC